MSIKNFSELICKICLFHFLSVCWSHRGTAGTIRKQNTAAVGALFCYFIEFNIYIRVLRNHAFLFLCRQSKQTCNCSERKAVCVYSCLVQITGFEF